MARARSSGRNDACRMARLAGANSAPPTPWTTRAAMSNPGVRREAADGRGGGEPDDADREDPLAAVAVAERTAEEEEGRQRQRVPGDHPLQRADAPVEVAADGGERDADDGRIEHGDARAEHRGRQDPATPPARQRQGVGCGSRRGRAAGVGPRAHRGQACVALIGASRTRCIDSIMVPGPSGCVRPACPGYFKMLTARATTRIPTTRETADSAIIMSFAQVLTADTSVGLKAVAVANAKWR